MISKNKLLRLAAWVFVSATTSSAFAGPFGYSKGHWTIFTEGDFYQTQDNYDGAGNKYPLVGRNYYYQYALTQGLRYDLRDNISLFTTVSGSQVKTHDDILALERSRTTLNEFMAGADVLFDTGFVNFIPEAKIYAPFNPIDSTSVSPLANEGVFKVQGGMYATKDLSAFLLIGYLGFQYRNGRSSLMPWSVHLATDIQRILLDAEVSGYSSVIDDPDTNNQRNQFQRLGMINTNDAGSFRYYTLNPSSTEAKVWGGVRIGDDTTLQVGYGTTLTGVRAAAGQSILVNFSMGFDSKSRRSSPHRGVKPHIEEERNTSGFQPDESEEPKPLKAAPKATLKSTSDEPNPTSLKLQKKKRVKPPSDE